MRTVEHEQHDIDQLLKHNQELKASIEAMRHYILQLEEFIRHGRQKQFGASSEQVANQHPSLFDEAETASAEVVADEAPEIEEEAPAEAKPARKPRKGFRIPPELPRVEIIHDLPESQKTCPHDGTVLKHIKDEISEQLDVIPAQVQVLRHVRRTYACPCCEQHLATAKKPAQPIEKSMASPRLLAMIATQKYVDGMPLYARVQGLVKNSSSRDLDALVQFDLVSPTGVILENYQKTLFRIPPGGAQQIEFAIAPYHRDAHVLVRGVKWR